MKVSLAMPIRNMGGYVGAAVRSVLTQSHQDVELLVHDAGSTDDTAAVLVSLADPRLLVVSEQDEGQADAINRGLSRSSGEILGWLNADDGLEDGALEHVVAAFHRYPDVELVYGRGYYADPDGTRRSDYPVRQYDRRLLLTRDYILQPACFWRRNLWDRVGPLDTTLDYGFDWDWLIRASRVTPFCFLDLDLAWYGITGLNKSLTGGTARQSELAAVARRYGGILQPTYLYWNFYRLQQRIPLLHVVERPLLRAFRGRVTT
ncbi:MAG TPA: glycosyltransferase family 2 protein [Gaiellaceae bacterium]|nr:glycosyltransferase family 2 protein [Gaiellaceae bacterium]